jgi:chromosome segregation ATPase
MMLPIPATRQEIAAIRSRRAELSSQLNSASDRRSELAQEMARQPAGPARDGMQSRLSVLDARLAQLEADIAATGRQLTAASVNPSSPEVPVNDIPENVLALSIVFTLFVLFPIAITFARNLWKRGNRKTVTERVSPETNERLERLEQGVEAIAIEIERVSEGQRFVTKLLAEGTGPTARIQQPESVAERV